MTRTATPWSYLWRIVAALGLVAGAVAAGSPAEAQVAPPIPAPSPPVAPATPAVPVVPPSEGGDGPLTYPDWWPGWLTDPLADDCAGLLGCAWEAAGDWLGGPSGSDADDPFPQTQTYQPSQDWSDFLSLEGMSPIATTYGDSTVLPVVTFPTGTSMNQAAYYYLVTAQVAPDQFDQWIPLASSEVSGLHAGYSFRINEAGSDLQLLVSYQRSNQSRTVSGALTIPAHAVDGDGRAHVLLRIGSQVHGGSGNNGTPAVGGFVATEDPLNPGQYLVTGAHVGAGKQFPQNNTFWSGSGLSAQWLPDLWTHSGGYPDPPAPVLLTYYPMNGSQVSGGGTLEKAEEAAAAFYVDPEGITEYTPWIPEPPPELIPPDLDPTPDTIPEAPPASAVPQPTPSTSTPPAPGTAPSTPEGDAASFIVEGLGDTIEWLFSGLAGLFTWLGDLVVSLANRIVQAMWDVASWMMSHLPTWFTWLVQQIGHLLYLAMTQLIEYLGLMLGYLLQGVAFIGRTVATLTQAMLAFVLAFESVLMWALAWLLNGLYELAAWFWDVLLWPGIELALGYVGSLFGWLWDLALSLFVPTTNFQARVSTIILGGVGGPNIGAEINEIRAVWPTVTQGCPPTWWLPLVERPLTLPTPSDSGCPGNGESGERLPPDDKAGDLWGYRSAVRAVFTVWILASVMFKVADAMPWSDKQESGSPEVAAPDGS